MDITEEIPFSIPANWKWVRIRDVFQLNPKNEADDETLAAFIPMEKVSAGYKSDFTFDLVKWGNIKRDLLILRMVTLLLLKLRHVFKTESLQFSMAYLMESGQELQN